jgi:phage host-nuclease inhibitor protein Gam
LEAVPKASKAEPPLTSHPSRGREERGPIFEIQSLEDANAALEQLGRLDDQIAVFEARGRKAIRRVQTWMEQKTAADLAEGAAILVVLEAFAKKKRKLLFSEDKKSLTLRFGSIGFRFTPWSIVFLKGMTEDVILKKLKAHKLKAVIRVVESIDKNAALNLDDKVLENVGMEKTREERFFYKLNPRAPAAPSHPVMNS